MENPKSKDFKLINLQNIDKKVSGLIKNPKNESILFKNRLNGFICIGVFCILGIILIIVGAFFQKPEKRHILIAVDVIGAILVLIGIFMSFFTPIKNFKVLNKQFESNFSNQKRLEIYDVFFCQFESFKFSDLLIEEDYLLFKLNDIYQTKYEDKKIFLYKNDKKIKELDKRVFDTNIKFNSSLTDSFKGSNVESFTSVISLTIKVKVKSILDYLSQEVDTYEKNN